MNACEWGFIIIIFFFTKNIDICHLFAKFDSLLMVSNFFLVAKNNIASLISILFIINEMSVGLLHLYIRAVVILMNGVCH